MAQQLAQDRTPAAYTGVTHYAQAHTGDAAAAAYVSLGHAYLLDHRLPDAISALSHADAAGSALDGRDLPSRQRVVIPTWSDKRKEKAEKRRPASIFGAPKPAGT